VEDSGKTKAFCESLVCISEFLHVYNIQRVNRAFPRELLTAL